MYEYMARWTEIAKRPHGPVLEVERRSRAKKAVQGQLLWPGPEFSCPSALSSKQAWRRDAETKSRQ